MSDYSKCCLTKYPTPVLMESAKPVEKINDEIRQLAEQMIDIMIETKGVGVAGPQAGVNLRIFVVSIDGTRESAKVYINPTIKVEGPLVANEEGCLSFPNMYTKVKRYRDCQVTAQDIHGQSFTAKAEGGLYSRCIQHEYDHIEGITLANRMSQAARIVNRRLLRKLEEQHTQ